MDSARRILIHTRPIGNKFFPHIQYSLLIFTANPLSNTVTSITFLTT